MAEQALARRRVLVVGASSGIGAGLAKAVVAAGGAVTVSARRADALARLVDEMGTGHAAVGDASIPADAERVAAEASEAMGGLDLMVYVAGYGPLQRLSECDPDLWADVYRVNVVGAKATQASLDGVRHNLRIPFGLAAAMIGPFGRKIIRIPWHTIKGGPKDFLAAPITFMGVEKINPQVKRVPYQFGLLLLFHSPFLTELALAPRAEAG